MNGNWNECGDTFILTNHLQKWVFTCIHIVLPVTVIVVGIVTSQSRETAQADGIREEDLSSSIHPHLKEKWEIKTYST